MCKYRPIVFVRYDSLLLQWLNKFLDNNKGNRKSKMKSHKTLAEIYSEEQCVKYNTHVCMFVLSIVFVISLVNVLLSRLQ